MYITNIDEMKLEHTKYKAYRIHIDVDKTGHKQLKNKKPFLEVVLTKYIYSKPDDEFIVQDPAVKKGIGMFKPLTKALQVKGGKQMKEEELPKDTLNPSSWLLCYNGKYYLITGSKIRPQASI